MTKSLLSLALVLLANLAVFGQDMESRTYFFPVNGSSFTLEMHKDLTKFVQSLDEIEKVEIYGFCDSTGSMAINEKLSKIRANSAKRQLINRGVDKSKISIKGLGETSPISTRVPNYDFNHNRKVEIVCYVKWDPKNNVELLYEKIEDTCDFFTVRPMHDTALITTNNSMIVIAKNSFKTTSNDPIQLCVKEFFNKSQMVSNNITTLAEGKYLSNGMIVDIIAIQGKDTLEAKLNTPIQISIPTDNPLENRKVFYGDRKETKVDWYQGTEGGAVHTSMGPASKGIYPGVIRPQDTLTNPKSKVCDSLRQIEDEELVAKFNLFQKIFWGKKKKDAIIAELLAKKEARDSCEACYAAYKAQEMGKKQRKMAMKNLIKVVKGNKHAEWIENDMDGNMDEVNYYIFNATKTGLINVDNYKKYNKKTVDIIVTDCNQSINAKLVFNDSKIMLPAEKTKDGFIFRGVPSSEKVTIFAIQYKDEKIGFYHESFMTDNNSMKFYMAFEETTEEAIDHEFIQLDK